MMTSSTINFRGLDHIGMTVENVDAVVAFYIDVFGGEILYQMGPLDSRDMPPANGKDWTAAHIDVPDALVKFTGVRIAGTLQLEIYEYARPTGQRSPPRNYDVGGRHFALRVDDLDGATEHVKGKGCTLMDGAIVPPDGPLSGSRSQYFRDPFGNYFELTEYDRMAFMGAIGDAS